MMVSVIIPVYQVSDYVERCLQSVLKQTYTALECIIVDDATKDDSIEKCERLIREYDGPIQFRMLHHDENRGLSAARNTGTKAATGDYVCYVDSDDEMTPDCIEKLVSAALEHPEAELVIGNAQFFWMGQKERVSLDDAMPALIPTNRQTLSYYYQQRITNGAWNKLLRRSFIEEHGLYFKEGIIIEDVLWMFYVLKYVSIVALVKDITYHYYKRAGSVLTSSSKLEIGRSYKVIYEDILQHLTVGREGVELSHYVVGFCRYYLAYKSEIPAYKELHILYRKLSKKHGCWVVYAELSLVRIMSCLGNPMSFLGKLNNIRWKVKRLFWT